jgi:hypothetical protein
LLKQILIIVLKTVEASQNPKPEPKNAAKISGITLQALL